MSKRGERRANGPSEKKGSLKSNREKISLERGAVTLVLFNPEAGELFSVWEGDDACCIWLEMELAARTGRKRSTHARAAGALERSLSEEAGLLNKGIMFVLYENGGREVQLLVEILIGRSRCVFQCR